MSARPNPRSKVSGSSSAKSKPKRPPREALSVEDRIKKLYKSLHDQLENDFLDNGLKTCQKILRLDPSNDLASKTRIQILISLSRFAQVISENSNEQRRNQFSLENAYCLTKLGQEGSAETQIETLKLDTGKDVNRQRAGELLEAQVKYRIGDFESSTNLYHDLLVGVNKKSDEYADLSSNLTLSSDRLDFANSLPSMIKKNTSNSVETLENRPIAPLLVNHPNFKPKTTAAVNASETSAQPASAVKKGKAKKPKRLPKGVTWDPKNPYPPKDLDPERWLPMKQRSYYVPPSVEVSVGTSKAAKRKKKLEKEREQMATQGSTTGDSNPKHSGGNSAGKKKKGKK